VRRDRSSHLREDLLALAHLDAQGRPSLTLRREEARRDAEAAPHPGAGTDKE